MLIHDIEFVVAFFKVLYVEINPGARKSPDLACVLFWVP